ncbi:riboflavin biosynthesis protein RibF [Paracidobacterium acidisoli]|uniref:Riboflavin biosynthesis protein n=1 Tax=Paracidobacterium acidisoli TaxID=2303751 RepID=A0A372IJV2_9BACT|nr:riboflavin biosynthesis protein RibF [Paracidobacterium acidisoli]MBT9333064.1 riboflavin biosynthesis protein RibF [Paracidobacterium acidisoli]
MNVYRSIGDLPAPLDRSVVAIGNFDGVHRGHQMIIQRVRERARELQAVSLAVTFDPHPVAVLHPEYAPKLITPMAQRLALLAETGLDAALVLPFTHEFSRLSADDFARGILRDALHAAEVHEGDNFRFGHGATAGLAELKELGQQLGFAVVAHGALRIRGIDLSSSQIRRIIADGRLALARALLGRPFSVRSTPAHGRGIGSKLTVPTINLAPYADLLPPNGVYVTRMKIGTGAAARVFNAVTNAGVRPTFGEESFAVESYLLNFEAVDLSEQTPLELCFLARIREERRFPSPEALKAQILRDVAWAQHYFRRAGLI